MRDAGGELAERGKFLGLDQAVLRSAQFFQRARKLSRAGPKLLEQPYVLDGDRRLVGKGSDQFDLLVGERPHLGAGQREYADRHTIAHHRHAQHGAEFTDPLRLGESIVGIRHYVRNMDDDPLEQGASDRVAALRLDRNVADKIDEFLREAVEFAAIERAAFLPSYGCLVGITLSRRGLDERLEHGRQVERRPTNHLQHFSSGGLLLQRFPQLLQKAMVLDGNNRLFCEIAEQGRSAFRRTD